MNEYQKQQARDIALHALKVAAPNLHEGIREHSARTIAERIAAMEDPAKPHTHKAGTLVGKHIDECALCGQDLRADIHSSAPAKAVEVAADKSNIRVNCGRDGVWLHFSASTGKRASLHVGNLAERQGGIIGAALRDWAADIESAAQP